MKKWLTILFSIFATTSVYAQEIPWITDMPLDQSETRALLTREYTETHYGRTIMKIVPMAVVVHWTAADTWESTYNYFYSPERADGTLNVASHFLVDKDGTIYRLTEETALNRHAIGYNWCAIGIENVGGVDGEDDHLPEQPAEDGAGNILRIYERYGVPAKADIDGIIAQTDMLERPKQADSAFKPYEIKTFLVKK